MPLGTLSSPGTPLPNKLPVTPGVFGPNCGDVWAISYSRLLGEVFRGWLQTSLVHLPAGGHDTQFRLTCPYIGPDAGRGRRRCHRWYNRCGFSNNCGFRADLISRPNHSAGLRRLCNEIGCGGAGADFLDLLWWRRSNFRSWRARVAGRLARHHLDYGRVSCRSITGPQRFRCPRRTLSCSLISGRLVAGRYLYTPIGAAGDRHSSTSSGVTASGKCGDVADGECRARAVARGRRECRGKFCFQCDRAFRIDFSLRSWHRASDRVRRQGGKRRRDQFFGRRTSAV